MGRLTEEELLSNVTLLFGAGHETTVNLIGNGLLALLEHRDQLDLLRAAPELAPNAVEELLRFDSPIQFVQRWARQDVEVGGVVIGGGDSVVLLLGSANRDPEQFRDPDTLDITRVGIKPMSLGGGPHFCVGAALGRLEAQTALLRVIERFPDVRLANQAMEWTDNALFHGVRQLPVTFTSARSLPLAV